MQAVIYTRFSTDLQKDTSIDDQVRVCRAKADALGFDVIAVHSDSAVSGMTQIGSRPAGRSVLEDALRGRFSVLLVESLDRLARDSVEQEVFVRKMEHRGIRIIGCSDGYDTQSGETRYLARGVRGLINESYIRDLRHKTHRGLHGQISRGFYAGGLSYGYRSVPQEMNAKGEPAGYRLEVVPEEAEVLRRIYREFADGRSCQKIAHALNENGIRGPRSGTWGVSVLYGSPGKGSGILNNELYRGRYIWNRSRWEKDPDTRKRVRLVRPESEWVVEDRPELRIVDDELWAAVRRRFELAKQTHGAKREAAKRTLLGGLIRCGKCGGAVIAINKYAYGCVNHKDRGTSVCTGLFASRAALEEVVINYLRDNLLSPKHLDDLEAGMAAMIEEAKRGLNSEIDARRRRVRTLEDALKKLLDAVATMGISPSLAQRIKETERDLELARRAPEPVNFDVNALTALVRRNLKNLDGALRGEIDGARVALRDILEEATLNEDDKGVYLQLRTNFDRMLLAGSEVGVLLRLGEEREGPFDPSRVSTGGCGGAIGPTETNIGLVHQLRVPDPLFRKGLIISV